jgi:hypothetical protein
LTGPSRWSRLLWKRETEGRVFDSPERKAMRWTSPCAPQLKRIADPSIRAHYGEEIKRLRLGVVRPAWGRGDGPPAAMGAKRQRPRGSRRRRCPTAGDPRLAAGDRGSADPKKNLSPTPRTTIISLDMSQAAVKTHDRRSARARLYHL